MPTYRYEATDPLGKSLRGTIEAESLGAAIAAVEARGLALRSIGVDERAPAEGPLAGAVDRLLALRDRLVTPLRAYAEEAASGRRRRELLSAAKLLESGERERVVAAVAAEPTAWGPLLAAASGEGTSPFAVFVQRERPVATLRRRRRLAAIYPLVVGGLCLAIGWPIATVVLPEFEMIFNDFGLELPAATELVVSTGRFVRNGGLVILLVLATLAYLVWQLLRLSAPQLSATVSDWLRGAGQGRSLASARLAAHTANLAEARLPLPLAGHAAAQRIGGPVARRSEAAIEGRALSGPYRSLDYALGVPMPEPSRVRLLRTLAACHNDLAAPRTAWAAGVAGPVTILVMGALVGLVVVALYLPLVTPLEGLT